MGGIWKHVWLFGDAFSQFFLSFGVGFFRSLSGLPQVPLASSLVSFWTHSWSFWSKLSIVLASSPLHFPSSYLHSHCSASTRFLDPFLVSFGFLMWLWLVGPSQNFRSWSQLSCGQAFRRTVSALQDVSGMIFGCHHLYFLTLFGRHPIFADSLRGN